MGTTEHNDPATGSTPSSLADLSTDEIVRALRIRAEQRRATGQYPVDLDADAAARIDRTVRAARVRPAGLDAEMVAALDQLDPGVALGLLAARVSELEQDLFDARTLLSRVERLEAAEQDRGFRP